MVGLGARVTSASQSAKAVDISQPRRLVNMCFNESNTGLLEEQSHFAVAAEGGKLL